MEPVDRLSLLWVWAFISAAFWMVSTAELPPAALSLDPKYPVYLQGEGVTLTCSAPEGQQVSGYIFYKEQQDRNFGDLLIRVQGPSKAFRVDQSTAGKYRCAYSIQLSGQLLLSPVSSPISVSMTELPGPPLFSVSPNQEVYRSGEFVSLRCLAPNRRHVSKITFLRDSQHLHITQDNFKHAFRLLLQDGGRYSCKYYTVESEREIPSLSSNVISICVIARGTNSSGAPTSPTLQLTSSQLAAEKGRTPAWIWHLAVLGSFVAINSVIFLITQRYQ